MVAQSSYCIIIYSVASLILLCTVYSGIAPGYSQEIGYSLFVIASCFGNSIQFVLSENVTPEVNLYVLLTLSALAVPLFSTADLHFGSGRSRHCCRRKQSVETSNQFEQDCKPKGMTHTRKYMISLFSMIALLTLNRNHRHYEVHQLCHVAEHISLNLLL